MIFGVTEASRAELVDEPRRARPRRRHEPVEREPRALEHADALVEALSGLGPGHVRELGLARRHDLLREGVRHSAGTAIALRPLLRPACAVKKAVKKDLVPLGLKRPKPRGVPRALGEGRAPVEVRHHQEPRLDAYIGAHAERVLHLGVPRGGHVVDADVDTRPRHVGQCFACACALPTSSYSLSNSESCETTISRFFSFISFCSARDMSRIWRLTSPRRSQIWPSLA